MPGAVKALGRCAHAGRVLHHVEAALGRELLAALGDETGIVGTHAEREADHRIGHRQLELSLARSRRRKHLDIALLDVAAVLAQMDGDAVRTRRLGDQRRFHGIGVIDPRTCRRVAT